MFPCWNEKKLQPLFYKFIFQKICFIWEKKPQHISKQWFICTEAIEHWNNSILSCMFCCNCVFECMSLLWKQVGSNIINCVFLEEYRNENLKFHTSLLMASPMTIRTEQNNVCIDLIRYRSSSYIQQLHTCVLER